jgi:hypothetical protein
MLSDHTNSNKIAYILDRYYSYCDGFYSLVVKFGLKVVIVIILSLYIGSFGVRRNKFISFQIPCSMNSYIYIQIENYSCILIHLQMYFAQIYLHYFLKKCIQLSCILLDLLHYVLLFSASR